MPEPLFENFSGGFRIKFVQAEKEGSADASNVPLNERLKHLLRAIQEKPGIQRKELVGKLGISDPTLDRYIAELISGGNIEHRGSKKTGGYWSL